jgi:hypothetical protein
MQLRTYIPYVITNVSHLTAPFYLISKRRFTFHHLVRAARLLCRLRRQLLTRSTLTCSIRVIYFSDLSNVLLIRGGKARALVENRLKQGPLLRRVVWTRYPRTSAQRLRCRLNLCFWHTWSQNRMRFVVMPSIPGRAVLQAVCRLFSTAAARVRSLVRSCGICGGQSGTGAGFL